MKKTLYLFFAVSLLFSVSCSKKAESTDNLAAETETEVAKDDTLSINNLVFNGKINPEHETQFTAKYNATADRIKKSNPLEMLRMIVVDKTEFSELIKPDKFVKFYYLNDDKNALKLGLSVSETTEYELSENDELFYIENEQILRESVAENFQNQMTQFDKNTVPLIWGNPANAKTNMVVYESNAVLNYLNEVTDAPKLLFTMIQFVNIDNEPKYDDKTDRISFTVRGYTDVSNQDEIGYDFGHLEP